MRYHRHNKGISLVEVLVAAALTAMLLAAVAAAVQGSLQSYTENQKLATATQTARSVLSRMAREIRNSEDCSITSTQLTILPIDTGNGLTRIDYELRGGVLYYRTITNGHLAESPLIGATGDEAQVASFALARVSGVDSLGAACTKSIRVKLTVMVGNRQVSVTASGDPRRNQLY